MKRKFYTLDVFTDTPLAGNPLAVVLDSEGLDDAAMQAIASEFNLSETVFVAPPESAAHRAKLRIFTPAHELPFAGHPTVGTAILLSQLNHLGEGSVFFLEEKVGAVKCVVSGDEGSRRARFNLPRLALSMDYPFDAAGWSKALGLAESDLDVPRCGLWDGGVPYTMVPVHSLAAVRKVKIDTQALAAVEPVFDGIAANPYVFCKGGETSDADFHARMFAPLFGIPEDPATGSAVASMSGWIATHDMGASASRAFKIEQGYEMGRPSQIFLDLRKEGGQTVEAGISGAAVIVSEGLLYL